MGEKLRWQAGDVAQYATSTRQAHTEHGPRNASISPHSLTHSNGGKANQRVGHSGSVNTQIVRNSDCGIDATFADLVTAAPNVAGFSACARAMQMQACA